MQIKSSNEWKVVFYTNCELFESLVMFFSITMLWQPLVKITNKPLKSTYQLSILLELQENLTRSS